MTDSELKLRLDAVRAGDMTAFEEIYNDLKTPIMTLAVRMTGDPHTAEDIFQEVFIKLYRSPPDPTIAKPRAYIFRMASNLAIDGIRRRQRQNEAPLDETEDVLSCKGPDLEEKMDVEAALSALPDAERSIVTLHVNGGLKFREIAQVTGLPSGTVLWKYRRALKRLRTFLEIK